MRYESPMSKFAIQKPKGGGKPPSAPFKVTTSVSVVRTLNRLAKEWGCEPEVAAHHVLAQVLK